MFDYIQPIIAGFRIAPNVLQRFSSVLADLYSALQIIKKSVCIGIYVQFVQNSNDAPACKLRPGPLPRSARLSQKPYSHSTCDEETTGIGWRKDFTSEVGVICFHFFCSVPPAIDCYHQR